VWLDRGELDKIIERNERSMKPYDDDRKYDDDRSRRHDSPPKRKKRTSFLSELFEGGD
jgi:Zn-finger nucleic acid-binding protein